MKDSISVTINVILKQAYLRRFYLKIVCIF